MKSMLVPTSGIHQAYLQLSSCRSCSLLICADLKFVVPSLASSCFQCCHIALLVWRNVTSVTFRTNVGIKVLWYCTQVSVVADVLQCISLPLLQTYKHSGNVVYCLCKLSVVGLVFSWFPQYSLHRDAHEGICVALSALWQTVWLYVISDAADAVTFAPVIHIGFLSFWTLQW